MADLSDVFKSAQTLSVYDRVRLILLLQAEVGGA
jgi:hypothetical protein